MLFSVTEIVILSEVKLDIEKQISYDIAYMLNLNIKKKRVQMNLQNKSRVRDVENKFMITRGLLLLLLSRFSRVRLCATP